MQSSGKISGQTAGQSSIEDSIAGLLTALVPEKEPVFVAFSGGLDSRVLLEVLVQLGKNPLRVIHVNHNIRPREELEKERELVIATCKKLKVSLTIAKIRPGLITGYARKKKCGVEAAARHFRYLAFKKTCKRFGFRYIATAHTADDQMETLIYRIFTGSNPESLGGIPKKREMGKEIFVVRPMLTLQRKDIELYARERQLEYSEDSTNSGTAYVRNRIRHFAIPALDKALPDWRSGLLRSAAQILKMVKLQNRQVRSVLQTSHRDLEERRISISYGLFSSQPEAVRGFVLRDCLQWVACKRNISVRACASAVDALEKGAEQIVCCGVVISRSKDTIIFHPEKQYQKMDGYCFLFHEPKIIRYGEALVGFSWEAVQEKFDHESADDMYLYEGSFSFPLIIRSRKAGDVIKTEKGHTAIDDILKSWHIQKGMRDIVPVIEDRDGIVAVLPALLGNTACSQKRFRPFSINGNPGKLHIILKGVSYIHV